MNKALRLISFLLLVISCFAVSSCKKQKISPVYYDVTKDIKDPKILPLFPSVNAVVIGHPGYKINLVGNVTDDQEDGKGGQLATFTLKVEELDMPNGTPINAVLTTSHPVDKLIAYAYNEKNFKAPSVLGLHDYRITLVAKDYATRTTTLSYGFRVDVQP